MTKTIVAAGLALLAGACGGTDIPGLPGSNSCTVTISGAITASATCELALGYSAASNKAAFGLSVTGLPATISAAAIAVDLATGDVASGNYTQANTLDSGVAVTTPSAQVWMETKNKSNSDQGSFTLNISSTGSAVTGSNGDKAYLNGHGSLTATLPGLASANTSGTVTLSATF
jgi:hypothetical protein